MGISQPSRQSALLTEHCALSCRSRVYRGVFAPCTTPSIAPTQAPGGHNVIMGLYDFVKRVNPESQVIGFLMGPHGLFSNVYEVITPEKMDHYRNMGVSM